MAEFAETNGHSNGRHPSGDAVLLLADGSLDWAKIVRRYGSIVYGTAMRLLRDEADAADCFQATFLAAFEASGREPVRHWPGLLRRIATSRALDVIRRRRRDRARMEAAAEPDHEATAWAGPVETLVGGELGERLRLALGDLPESQGEVFYLRYVDQLSYEQIAEATGLTGTHVGVLLHRARKQLRERLGEGGSSGAARPVARAAMGMESEVER